MTNNQVASSITTRKQMAGFFDDLLSDTSRRLKSEQELGFGENLLKSYLIEAHPESNSAIQLSQLSEKLGLRFKETKDEGLFVVFDENFQALVDAFDTRFLIFHSPSDSALTNKIMRDVTQYPGFDRAWLDSSFLEQISTTGEFEGLASRFDSKELYSKKILDADEVDWEKISFSIRSRPNKTNDRYGELKRLASFEGVFPLTAVRLKRVNQTEEYYFSRSDITSAGKITGRGNSFSEHMDVVRDVLRDYRNLISKYEREFPISYSSNGKRGKPVNIEIPGGEFQPFNLLIDSWFNSTKPFMLWGISEYLSDNYVSVNAIDLHNNDKIMFEISPEFVRLYLPDGACGNSVSRFITNLQQHYNSKARLANDLK